jgi:vacuolar protein sorting-associated protein 13A/C
MVPVREYENEGAEGAFYGVFKGLFGVLTKPFSGAFDIISLTAEGIKNQSSVFDDKPNR